MSLLAFLPNALAYVFVALLLCIICFILIYVSHKLYLYLNDHLQAVGAGDSQAAYQKGMQSAVTVIVLFEKCYLMMCILPPHGDHAPKLIRYTESFVGKSSERRLGVRRTASISSRRSKR